MENFLDLAKSYGVTRRLNCIMCLFCVIPLIDLIFFLCIFLFVDTSDTIHTSEDDANVGITSEIAIASLPPTSIAGTSSSVGASAISDEIVDFFREFDKRRLNPHPEWHFWKFNGLWCPLGTFGFQVIVCLICGS